MDKKENKQKKSIKPPPPNMNNMRVFTILMVLFMGTMGIFHVVESGRKVLDYSEFYRIIENNLQLPMVESVTKSETSISGVFSVQGKESVGEGRPYFTVAIPIEDKELLGLLRKNVGKVAIEHPKIWGSILASFLPMIFIILLFWFIAQRGSQMGSRVWSFGRSKARIIEKEKVPKITFLDVAGVDEAKEELKEVVLFLREPKRFQRLGGRIPKGVILVGPPGCGKTMLAKAVAGEAEVPFFSISGSDFVELFVGVGASRVRDLFEQAKKAAKVEGKGGIIFIDEIDAVGRQRFAGIGGGHDEREQTLNQLLVEMDGFQTEVGVIVMAATNRPDVLDPALLRPGRFDRHIVVDAPDIKGREAILKVHTRKIKLADESDLAVIAKQTPGFSGADLENLCNEAALLAARRERQAVGIDEMQEAMERVVAGPQRKSRVISKHEKEIIAYHEGGHSLLSLYLPNVDPLHKVSIIPRGIGALGYTLQLPQNDKYIHSKSELLDQLCVLLGGRAAEEIVLGEVTTGAHNDLEAATHIARRMVTEFGMSKKIGHIALGRKEGPVFLGKELVEHKDYSDDTAQAIDSEIKVILENAYQRASDILIEKVDKLKEVAGALLDKEVLDAQEVKQIIGFKDDSDTDRDKEQKESS
ncbi:MAG: ATP-dependent zinc metalloprotease FtsH [Candidatus Omnitrophota bacterium]